MPEHDVKVKVKETVEKTAEQLITTTAKDGGSVDYAGAIIDHLDIWTTAIEQKSASGRGSSKKFSLHGIKKLRELILELAVRGKLVPQDANDEPASVLLERIAAEKAQLVKDKKIKKPKALPEISEDEKPFVLPHGWEWSQLGFLTNYGVCDKAEPHEASDGDWVLELEDVEKGTSKLLKKVRFKERAFKSSKNRFEVNDVIYGKLRPYLDKVLIADEAGVCTTEMIPVRAYSDLRSDYLRLVMKSPYFIKYANESTHGMNLPRMGTDKARAALFPLAPLEEQQRIVAKVDELMSLCDALEAQTEASLAAHQTLVETLLGALLLPSAHTENTNSENKASDATIDVTSRPAQISSPEHAVDNSLERAVENSPERTFEKSPEQSPTNSFAKDWQRVAEHFDTLFTTSASIDTLKQTILQLAVMGKLVEQDANDEPAAKLLKRIAAEKAQLIADKKIKKQKPLPAITDEEKPFELPHGWVYSRLDDLCLSVISGSTPPKSELSETGEIPFLKVYNIQNQEIDFKERTLFVTEEAHLGKLKRSILYPGDVVMNLVGPPLGKIAIIPNTFPEWNCNQNVICFRPIEIKLNSYIYTYLVANIFLNHIELVGSAGQDFISGTKSRAIALPFPPLEEQHRIVTKVDELMALCDQLKARLSDAQTTQLHLTDAIVEQAV
ncbi:restriction endonuclease subunit S [Shewanella colwelliana]|uniref:restriction endonuclease subunit S n=1 Tax=Shewanella colwelliana TaxID=23 RepID=UPI0022AF3D9A|nr:restriction endonuclease subunit S [Shewanella colwelliana]MCZ4337369.1 restriction endonuclease subunit S [Shewanella colwelliana]